MAIEVSLTKSSQGLRSRYCVICGSAKMTHSYQLGESKYSVEIDDECLVRITMPPAGETLAAQPTVESTKPKRESRGGSK